jgi:hypothetical protein
MTRHFCFFTVLPIISLSIKNSMAHKTSAMGLSVMCIRSRPQNLSLLSSEMPIIFNHKADAKQKMMQKLRMYLATFIQVLRVYAKLLMIFYTKIGARWNEQSCTIQ